MNALFDVWYIIYIKNTLVVSILSYDFLATLATHECSKVNDLLLELFLTLALFYSKRLRTVMPLLLASWDGLTANDVGDVIDTLPHSVPTATLEKAKSLFDFHSIPFDAMLLGLATRGIVAQVLEFKGMSVDDNCCDHEDSKEIRAIVGKLMTTLEDTIFAAAVERAPCSQCSAMTLQQESRYNFMKITFVLLDHLRNILEGLFHVCYSLRLRDAGVPVSVLIGKPEVSVSLQDVIRDGYLLQPYPPTPPPLTPPSMIPPKICELRKLSKAMSKWLQY